MRATCTPPVGEHVLVAGAAIPASASSSVTRRPASRRSRRRRGRRASRPCPFPRPSTDPGARRRRRRAPIPARPGPHPARLRRPAAARPAGAALPSVGEAWMRRSGGRARRRAPPERGEVGARRADSDAREPGVGRKDVCDLVAVQRELGSVGGFAAWAAPSGHVAVVQGAEGFDLVLDRGATSRATSEWRPSAPTTTRLSTSYPPSPIAEPGPHHRPSSRRSPTTVAGCATSTPAVHAPPGAAAGRRAALAGPRGESGLAGLLGRPLVRAGGAEAEAPLPRQGWGAQREHLVEQRQPLEHRDEPFAAEEVGRDRGAREPHPLDEEHADPAVSQERATVEPAIRPPTTITS